jgi:Family of unknown function (DUF6088)
MLTTARIRRHINSIPAGTPFSTREFLHYGLRSTVDHIMWCLVHTKQIIRLTRGVFTKPPTGSLKLPTAMDIAATKAKAFGKEIYTHGRDAAHNLKLVESGNNEMVFTVNGRSTSFLTIYGRVYFSGTNSKNVKKGNNPVALIVRALQYLNIELTKPLLSKITEPLGRTQRNDLKQDVRWMPARMSDPFIRFWYA